MSQVLSSHVWLVATVLDSAAYSVVSAIEGVFRILRLPHRGDRGTLGLPGTAGKAPRKRRRVETVLGAQEGFTSSCWWVPLPLGAHHPNPCAGSRGRGRGYRGRGSRGGSRGRGMGRGGRGRGRGSVGGDHPEDEDDFYEEEMEVRFPPAGRGGVWLLGCRCRGGRPERPRCTERQLAALCVCKCSLLISE